MMPPHTPSWLEKDCQQRTRGEYATRRGLIDKEYSWGNDLSIGHDYAHVGSLDLGGHRHLNINRLAGHSSHC